jgi:hypothetical protein
VLSLPAILPTTDAGNKPMERHYSPEEVADLWRLSVKTILRLFTGEPGIIEFGNIGNLKKRRYITIRIPESVLNRIHRRLRILCATRLLPARLLSTRPER